MEDEELMSFSGRWKIEKMPSGRWNAEEIEDYPITDLIRSK